MGAKLHIKSENITSFGGIFFVNRFLQQNVIPQLVDKELDMRSTIIGYQYAEILSALFNIFLSGSNLSTGG